MVLFCVAENTDCFGPVGLKSKLSLCLINQHAAKACGGGGSEVVHPRTLKPPHWMELCNHLFFGGLCSSYNLLNNTRLSVMDPLRSGAFLV